MRAHGYDQYRSQQITTATPAELIGLLYDAAIAAALNAKAAIEGRRAADVHDPLMKAQDILTELRCALNADAGEIATRLDAIYVYCIELLVKANTRREAVPVAEMVMLLEPIRDAWRQACVQGAVPAVAAS